MEKNNIFKSDVKVETIIDLSSLEDDSTTFKGHDNMSETSSHHNIPQNSLDQESMIIVEEDDGSSLSNIINSENTEIRKKIDESTSIQTPELIPIENIKIEDDSDIEVLDQQVPIKKEIRSAIVINTTENSDLSTSHKKQDSLNLEKIAIPKNDVSNIKLSSSLISCQIKKSPSVSIVPTSSVISPTTAVAMLHPNSRMAESSYNKSFQKPKQEVKIITSNESNSEVYVIPRTAKTYMVSKEKALDTATASVEQKKKYILTRNPLKRGGKFIARMQKLPDGKYQMVSTQGNLPIDMDNFLLRNSNFIKQKLTANSNASEHRVNDVYHLVKPHKLANVKETINFRGKKTVTSSENSLWNKMSKSVDFGKDKKYVYHTITSKDAIENHNNFIIENREIKLKKNGNQEVCASGFIQLPPKTETYIQSGSLPSSTKYGKIIENNIAVQLLSLDSLNKSKTKMNTHFKEDGKHSFTKIVNQVSEDSNSSNSDEIISVFPVDDICATKDLKIIRAGAVQSKKILLPGKQDEVFDKGDKSVQFVPCQYQYCDTVVHEPELIDNLYCSLTCKRLKQLINDSKQLASDPKQLLTKKFVNDSKKLVNDSKRVVTVEPVNKPEEIINQTKKPIIDRKQLLAKLENRINKRKQLLTSHPEKMAENDDWDDLEQFEDPCKEPAVIENQPPLNAPCLNSPHQISSPETVDEIDEIFFDFQFKIKDNKLLNYMEEMQFNSAPKHLFDKPFPTEKNLFKVGQKLEGIDPLHEALFCVMTIVNVCGYRLKLHFDGYPDNYDFWVNADCPDLFYPGWCEQNSRILQPPKNYGVKFDWSNYFKECHLSPTPKRNFASTKNLINCTIQHKFTVGAKLEALDKFTRTIQKQLICVATVADILGNRIRIHFDGWKDDYDYWTDITSTTIHPVGWCDNNGRILSPPSGYNDSKGKKPFNWTDYLIETNSKPVPEDAFFRRPLRDFSINMTIEVVDIAVPSLIRIAKIVDIKGDEIKILYDGFHKIYAYWVEDDSPDIHPVGWAFKTNHPVELPPDELKSCKIDGCNGKGNINRLDAGHIFAKDCPYELDEWKRVVAGLGRLPDRLKIKEIPIATTVLNSKSLSMEYHEDENKGKYELNTFIHNNSNKNRGKLIHNKLKDQQLGLKNIVPEYSTDNSDLLNKRKIESQNKINKCKDIFLTIPLYSHNPITLAKRGRLWTMHSAQTNTVPFSTSDARKWTVEEVASFVDQVLSTKCSDLNIMTQDISERFKIEEIDGEDFLMLPQDDIMKLLRIPMGPAIKLASAIIILRQRVPAFDFEEDQPY